MTQFLNKFLEFVKVQNEILAVLLVGSQARGTARPDSDIDLVIITNLPEKYLNNDNWIGNFGEIRALKKEDFQLVQSRRVFYGSGLEIEYGITVPKWAKVNPIDEGTRRVVTDGAKVLYDKNGLLKSLFEALGK